MKNIKSIAEVITTFQTLDEARRCANLLGGLFGKTLPNHLKYNGFYACKIEGVNYYFELANHK